MISYKKGVFVIMVAFLTTILLSLYYLKSLFSKGDSLVLVYFT